MDNVVGVAVAADGTCVFVTAVFSNSVAIVDVSTSSSPVLVRGVTNATYTDDAFRSSSVARRQKLGYRTDSAAAVDVGTKSSSAVVVGRRRRTSPSLDGAFGVWQCLPIDGK
jgi:hypothetical protein